ncbi:YceD family protein [Dokdonella sp.]|uniref:YceD family protein n=1 Tax=Dokdonella sp. TaxID=2291710 RepID=UPI003C4C6DD7
MPNTVPDSIDPWRLVQARRVFEGTIPLRQMERLVGLLAAPTGDAVYRIEFGKDDFDIACADLRVDAGLSLVCQRTMQVFVQPVRIDQRLGLIRDEGQEAALPEGYEALLVENGQLRLKDVIEDELILALPLVALSPGAPLEQIPLSSGSVPEIDRPPNPFAVLGQLKKTKH